jgi:hypothetical protein
VSVLLDLADRLIAGTQNDLRFEDPSAAVLRLPNGRPDCTVNPAIDKDGTSFAFRPPGCAPDTCSGIRALVLATDNTDALPDMATLYTCRITAVGTTLMLVDRVIVSSPDGQRVPAVGVAGQVFFAPIP